MLSAILGIRDYFLQVRLVIEETIVAYFCSIFEAVPSESYDAIDNKNS